MAITYNLIASNVLSSTAASVTFSSIPTTFTDLVLKTSVRVTDTGNTGFLIGFGSGTFTNRLLRGQGTSGASSSTNFPTHAFSAGGSNAANTFGSVEIYIPNYTGTLKKSFGIFGVQEDNSSGSFVNIGALAMLWSASSAINSITLTPNNTTNFASGSSFFLYGIKNF